MHLQLKRISTAYSLTKSSALWVPLLRCSYPLSIDQSRSCEPRLLRLAGASTNMLSCSVLVQPQDKHWGALDNWEWAVKGISSSTVWDCSPSGHLFSLCPTAWNHCVYWFMPTKLTPGLEKTAFLGIVPCPSLGESVKHSLKPLWLTSPELNCTKKVFNFF